ncbi:MAG: glycosyltransferase family 4 protein [Pseudomonadota bacterium]
MSATSYPRSNEDWQGVFIRHIATALAERNSLTLWAPDGPRAEAIQYAPLENDRRWLAALSERGGIAHLLSKRPAQGVVSATRLLARLRSAYRKASGDTDVFHINWMQNALPLAGLPNPAVIAVLGSDFKLLKLPGMRTAMRAMLRQRRAVLTPNAEWMVEQLQNDFGDLAQVTAVPFGVDDRWYKIDRTPEKPFRWLVVQRVTRDKMGPLFSWGDSLFSGGQRELHLIGPNQENLSIPDWVHYHGAASPDALAQDWFPEAAGLLTLSEHSEGRPQVILESMAAGLPVIASDLPAHRDVISSGKTGWIVNNETSFREAVSALEQIPAQRDFAVHCRQFALERYGTWQDCAQRYESLYQQLTAAP